ncbi:MAG: hypothetical protein ACLQDV_03270 [Candidatus Binataceae bacterium]
MSAINDDHWRLIRLRCALCFLSAVLVTIGIPLRSIAAQVNKPAVATNAFMVQDDESSPDDTDVPPQEVDKYIKVYKAMQQNHSLTVEQAASQQGLSVSDFRSLEDRIQRNDALLAHVRESLRPQASASPGD